MTRQTLYTSGMVALCTLLFFTSISARSIGHPLRSYRETKINTLEVTPSRVWQEFSNRNTQSTQRVVLFCKLDLYRHGKPLRVKHITLQWKPLVPGAHPPEHLTPVLYQPKYKKVFNPTSHAAITDGSWDKATQTIHFDLEYKVIGRHQFYVVLLAHNDDLQRLANGHFIYTDSYPLRTEAITQ